ERDDLSAPGEAFARNCKGRWIGRSILWDCANSKCGASAFGSHRASDQRTLRISPKVGILRRGAKNHVTRLVLPGDPQGARVTRIDLAGLGAISTFNLGRNEILDAQDGCSLGLERIA